MEVAFSAYRVGVLLKQWDAFEMTAGCIRAISDSNSSDAVDIRFFVLDDRSVDDSPDRLSSEFPDLVLVRTAVRSGFCSSFNYLAHLAIAAGCTHLFIVNNDTRAFSRDYFATLISALKSDPSLAAVSSVTNDFEGRPLHFRERDWAGVPAPLASEGYLIPAEVWGQVGGFNERFVVYCEDLEWQERARRTGLTLRLVRECSFEHLGNGSSSTMVFAPTFYLLRNVIWIHRVRTGRRLGRQHLRQFGAKSTPILRRAVRESVQSPSRALKRILAILLAGASGFLTSPGRAVPHDPDAFIRARRPEHWGLAIR